MILQNQREAQPVEDFRTPAMSSGSFTALTATEWHVAARQHVSGSRRWQNCSPNSQLQEKTFCQFSYFFTSFQRLFNVLDFLFATFVSKNWLLGWILWSVCDSDHVSVDWLCSYGGEQQQVQTAARIRRGSTVDPNSLSSKSEKALSLLNKEMFSCTKFHKAKLSCGCKKIWGWTHFSNEHSETQRHIDNDFFFTVAFIYLVFPLFGCFS